MFNSKTCLEIISKAWLLPKILQNMGYCQLVVKKNQKDPKVADGVDPPRSPHEKIGQGLSQVEWIEYQTQQRKASILTCKKHAKC